MTRIASASPHISRVRRSAADARRNYNRLSSLYDILTITEQSFTRVGLARLAPAAGERILEIGYGTGRALVRLARAVGPSGRILGMDISEGMRTIAVRRLERAGLSTRVELRTGDALVLPYDSGSLDAVFMGFTLELFDTPEIPVVLMECQRVLRPLGRICVISMAAEVHPGLVVRLYEWMHARFPAMIDCRPILGEASLQGAGFRIQAASRHRTWGLPLDICLADKAPA